MSNLKVAGVNKRFGGIVAADNVTFEIASGRITGLIGPNGAGKTTIINLITGVLKPDSGTIELDGLPLHEKSIIDIAKIGVGRTFQNIKLLNDATVLDNILIGFHKLETASGIANLFGLPSAWRETNVLRQRAYHLLERFNMVNFANYRASEISYGHQRRVEIMRALAASPKVLLLDEPVAGMNDVEANELGDEFRKLASEGMAILLVEHNISFVGSVCTTVYVLSTGQVLAAGPTVDVLADPKVVAAYLGE